MTQEELLKKFIMFTTLYNNKEIKLEQLITKWLNGESPYCEEETKQLIVSINKQIKRLKELANNALIEFITKNKAMLMAEQSHPETTIQKNYRSQ